MNCKIITDHLLAIAAGTRPDPAVEEHLLNCKSCSERLASLRGTMSLLDEWQAPEASPYFDARVRAKLREETTVRQGWLSWIRKPALALAMAGLMVVGIGLYQGNHGFVGSQVTKTDTRVKVQPGSAVDDLQKLDKEQDLLADFDLLDDLNNDSSGTQNLNP